MGIFDKIKEAKPNFSKNWVRAGHYYALVGECKQGKNGDDHDMVVINLTVVKIVDDNEGKGHKLHEETVQMISKKPKYENMFLGNIKSLVAALLEVQVDDVDEATCELMFGESQAVTGQVVEFDAIDKPQANDPRKSFTNVNYRRIVPPSALLQELDDEVIARYFPDDLLGRMVTAEEEAEAEAE